MMTKGEHTNERMYIPSTALLFGITTCILSGELSISVLPPSQRGSTPKEKNLLTASSFP